MSASARASGQAAPDAPVRPRCMTFEAYLACDDEHGLAEWVVGEVVRRMPATEPHRRIVEFLLALLRAFVRLRGLGRVIGAPFTMRALPGGNAREPDLLFVATANLGRLGRAYLDGPADLVVEVSSEDSAARDREEKFREYEKGGVREFWLIDSRPDRQQAEFFVLADDGNCRAAPLAADGRYASTVLPGFWLDLGWLWQDDPDEFAALAEISGARLLPGAPDAGALTRGAASGSRRRRAL